MLPDKQDVAQALLKRGSIFVHLNPAADPNVHIPGRLMDQPQVVLQVGHEMPVPIPDLAVGDEGISGTLSFKGVPFECFVPWGCVFAVIGEDAKGVVWDGDMPGVVKNQIARAMAPEKSSQAGAEVVDLARWRKEMGR